MPKILTANSFNIGAAPGTNGWTKTKGAIVYQLRRAVRDAILADDPDAFSTPEKADKTFKRLALNGVKTRIHEQ